MLSNSFKYVLSLSTLKLCDVYALSLAVSSPSLVYSMSICGSTPSNSISVNNGHVFRNVII